MNMFILRDKIATIAPVTSVSIGDPSDKTTWRVNYSYEPSDDILNQVQAIINNYVLLTPEQEETNRESLSFLSGSDWKVLRHQDQLLLGIATSLTQDEFMQLLQDRQTARDAIVKEGV